MEDIEEFRLEMGTNVTNVEERLKSLGVTLFTSFILFICFGHIFLKMKTSKNNSTCWSSKTT